MLSSGIIYSVIPNEESILYFRKCNLDTSYVTVTVPCASEFLHIEKIKVVANLAVYINLTQGNLVEGKGTSMNGRR